MQYLCDDAVSGPKLHCKLQCKLQCNPASVATLRAGHQSGSRASQAAGGQSGRVAAQSAVMVSRKVALWVLAGGAVLALGGLGWWLWRRNEGHGRADPETPPPEPDAADPDEPQGDSVSPKVLEFLERYRRGEVDAPPRPQPPPSPPPPTTPVTGASSAASPPPTEFVAREQLDELRRRKVEQAFRSLWDHRERKLDENPQLGDDVGFVACSDGVEVLVGEVASVEDKQLEVVVRGALGRGGLRAPKTPRITFGQCIEVPRTCVLGLARPEAEPEPLIARDRRRRYTVKPGETVELRSRVFPEGAELRASRDDVSVRVLRHEGNRAVVALEGSGDVNVALLSPDTKRPVTSWKFRLESAAA